MENMLQKIQKSLEEQKARLVEYTGVIEQIAQLKGAIAALEYVKSLIEAEEQHTKRVTETIVEE